MHNSRIRRITLSRKIILIPLVTLTLVAFIVSTSMIVSNANNDVSTISCNQGIYDYDAYDYDRFYEFIVDVKFIDGEYCGDPLIFPCTPTIKVFDIEDNLIFSTNRENDGGSVYTQSEEIRIDIEHVSLRYRKYVVDIRMRSFDIARPILLSFVSCSGLVGIASVLTFKLIKKAPQVSIQHERLNSIQDDQEESLDKDKLTREKPIQKLNLLKVQYVQIPKKAKCMISKTTFEKDDNIAQCPKCFSYYHLDYIVNWIKENHDCPVCQTMLK